LDTTSARIAPGQPLPLLFWFLAKSSIDIRFARGIISFVMHTTFAHISVATQSDIGLPTLFTRVEAHEERWESSTALPQTHMTTVEYQHAGIDRRWINAREHRTEAGALSVFAAGTRIEAEEISPGGVDHVEYLRLEGPSCQTSPDALIVHICAKPRYFIPSRQ
jgi:hypothetical protein